MCKRSIDDIRKNLASECHSRIQQGDPVIRIIFGFLILLTLGIFWAVGWEALQIFPILKEFAVILLQAALLIFTAIFIAWSIGKLILG